MEIFLSRAIAKLLTKVLGIGVNPRAVQCVLRYLSGSKKPLLLTGEELDLVKHLVLKQMLYGSYDRPICLGEKVTAYGHTSSFTRKESIAYGYLTHQTEGLIGSFDMRISDCGEYLECWDKWDFNVIDCHLIRVWLNLPVDSFLSKTLAKISEKYPQWVYHFAHKDPSAFKVGLPESKLRFLNSWGAFETRWRYNLRSIKKDLENFSINTDYD